MIVPQQVEHTVEQQASQLLVEAAMGQPSLSLGDLDPDHDVTQELAAMLGGLALDEGEGEHIRGSIDPPVTVIELSHFFVVDEGEGEL